MPLKIELKPHESIIIGESLITNDGERTRFYIEGNVPILREKVYSARKRGQYALQTRLFCCPADVSGQRSDPAAADLS